jgi:hypothetical protein
MGAVRTKYSPLCELDSQELVGGYRLTDLIYQFTPPNSVCSSPHKVKSNLAVVNWHHIVFAIPGSAHRPECQYIRSRQLLDIFDSKPIE